MVDDWAEGEEIILLHNDGEPFRYGFIREMEWLVGKSVVPECAIYSSNGKIAGFRISDPKGHARWSWDANHTVAPHDHQHIAFDEFDHILCSVTKE